MFDRFETMAVNGPGNVLVCGLSNGILSLRSLWNLEELKKIESLKIHGAINALWFTEGKLFSCSIYLSMIILIMR